MEMQHRRWVSLTVMAAACTVLLGSPLAWADGPVWPRPAPETRPVPGHAPPAGLQAQRQTAPNFQAPSAQACADEPLFHERADPSGQQGRPPLRKPDPGSAHAVEVFDDASATGVGLDRVEVTGTRVPAPAPPAPPSAPAHPLPASAHALVSPTPPRAQQGPVSAGVVDDNADFGAYTDFLARHAHSAVPGRPVEGRLRLQVVDARGRAVNDAEVAVTAANGARMWARTDAGGQVWVHPGAFDDQASPRYRVQVRRDGRQVGGTLERGQKPALRLTLPATPQPARLDLVFLLDATGSMGDEIDKLKASLQDIVRRIDALPSRPQVCLGLVSYRDKGDAYFVRRWDLTHNVAAFAQVLDGVQAGGGGDTPEAMNEAFDEAVQQLSWRGSGTTRLLVALADAPPQLGYGRPWHSDTMLAALGKGIKVFSVAASGQDSDGELVQRQIAQYAGGRFIFLTYQHAHDPSSGPGSQTVHEVRNYSVDTLDALVVRLVGEELARLPALEQP